MEITKENCKKADGDKLKFMEFLRARLFYIAVHCSDQILENQAERNNRGCINYHAIIPLISAEHERFIRGIQTNVCDFCIQIIAVPKTMSINSQVQYSAVFSYLL